MKYPVIPLAQTVVKLCKAKNIQHIVISPGSRNAPLTIGFTEDPFFKTYSIVDERCAAFFAMGMAQQTGLPAVVVCTSGSALLNYYPAVSEAFYSDIPLIVISADRPPYAIDIGDGQTIRQDGVFDRHIVYATNLKLDFDIKNPMFSGDGKGISKFERSFNPVVLQNEIQKFNEAELNKVLNKAFEEKGPVHVNVPFEEPLYKVTNHSEINPVNKPPFIQEEEIEFGILRSYIDKWNKASKKMILVGVNGPNRLSDEVIKQLASDPSVVVFTETTSNLHNANFIPCIDKIIAPLEKREDGDTWFKELQPDILLTFGGMVVSKKVKAFLRKYRPKHHWHIDEKKAYNTYGSLDKHFKTTPQRFFKAFLTSESEATSGYRDSWLDVRRQREGAHENYLSAIPFSDFKAFDQIFKGIPNGYQLQLSNSSTIRYAQLFSIPPAVKVFCNRGTSGIDGSTSTAMGAMNVSSEPVVFVTGDLSFFYDSNALWNAYTRKDFRIIIVNNGGGGIFRILPGNKNAHNFDTYFETTHDLNAKNLAVMYGYNYFSASTEQEVTQNLKGFFENSERPGILEIFTPRLVNDEVLLGYFDFLSKELPK